MLINTAVPFFSFVIPRCEAYLLVVEAKDFVKTNPKYIV